MEQMESDVYQSAESSTQLDENNNNQRRKSKRLAKASAAKAKEEKRKLAAVVTIQTSSPTSDLSNQPLPDELEPLPDYELANNDGDLEPTITTQAEKLRHLAALKLERIAPAMEQMKSMKTGDKTAGITRVIGNKYRAGYAKVTNDIKNSIAKQYQVSSLGKESTPTPEEIQLKSICNDTAQDIKKEYPGYNSNLLS